MFGENENFEDFDVDDLEDKIDNMDMDGLKDIMSEVANALFDKALDDYGDIKRLIMELSVKDMEGNMSKDEDIYITCMLLVQHSILKKKLRDSEDRRDGMT
jgi:hypothetical protein